MIFVICGPCLGRHGPKKARRALGPGWASIFTLWAGTARPEIFLGRLGPTPFGPKHDGLGPCRPDPAQFPALCTASGRSISHVSHGPSQSPYTCICSIQPAHFNSKDMVMPRHKAERPSLQVSVLVSYSVLLFFILLVFLYEKPCNTVFNIFTKLVQQFRKLNSTMRKKQSTFTKNMLK